MVIAKWGTLRISLIFINMIQKENLKIGGWYLGTCRNSGIALWDGGEFQYISEHFNTWIRDSISHYSDVTDDGYDGFIPISEVKLLTHDSINEEKSKSDYKGWYRNLYKSKVKTLDGEVWKLIPDYQLYEVSNLGRVRNGKGLILSSGFNKGYLYVGLNHNDGHRKNWRVHRLVATMFCDTPKEDEDEVDHINGIKTDNRAINIRWIDRVSNARAIYQRGTATKKLSMGDVEGIRKDLSEGILKQIDIGKKYGVGQSIISEIKTNKKWVVSDIKM